MDVAGPGGDKHQVPQALPRTAAESVVANKKDGHGITISSVSAPTIQATMLEQAEIKTGMRLAKIGSGVPGCNRIRAGPGGDGRQ